MYNYTVVLLRPDYLCDATGEAYGQDIYVAHVTGIDARQAIAAAKQQVFEADTRDKLEPNAPNDYALCVMFEGHHHPILFSWQEWIMAEVKTKDLAGWPLRWAIAQCDCLGEEWRGVRKPDGFVNYWTDNHGSYVPDELWEIGGPIIERECIGVCPDGGGGYKAWIPICDGMTDRVLHGPTPLIAAMRCYVASKLGDTVEVPDELIEKE